MVGNVDISFHLNRRPGRWKEGIFCKFETYFKIVAIWGQQHSYRRNCYFYWQKGNFKIIYGPFVLVFVSKDKIIIEPLILKIGMPFQGKVTIYCTCDMYVIYTTPPLQVPALSEYVMTSKYYNMWVCLKEK